MAERKRLRVLRVVTTSDCIPWHMDNTLKRLGRDFDVCVAGKDVSLYEGKYENIAWADIPIVRHISPIADFKALIHLCRLICSYRPDIVHSIMPKAAIISALAGFICRVPVRMHTFTGQVWATKQGLYRSFLKWMDRTVIALNTLCLTDSPSQSLFLHDEHVSQNGAPLAVLLKGSLSGVDEHRFNASRVAQDVRELKERLGLDDSQFVFAFLGRKNKDKGIYDLINAFELAISECPAIRLMMVGPDESNDDVAQFLRSKPSLADKVVDIASVDRPELYLGIGNALCIPSYREGFGSVVLEAGAMGIPAIGTDISGLRDAIIHGETGVICPPGDISSLARTMVLFAKDPQKARLMGQAAQSRVQACFSADIMYGALKDCYFEQAKILNR
jgi:glycosyltransferase involved in cell wall biosynthesis